MTRATKVFRFVTALTALWIVAGAEWPMETIMELLGRVRCC